MEFPAVQVAMWIRVGASNYTEEDKTATNRDSGVSIATATIQHSGISTQSTVRDEGSGAPPLL